MTTMMTARPRVGYGRGLLAGVGAGIAAGVAAVAVVAITGTRSPTVIPTWWSAFVSGLLGGLLYAVLTRVTRRPAAVLWIVVLAVAAIDSILIAALPLAGGPGAVLGVPLVGIMAPLHQALALVGIGHFGARHFPHNAVLADTAVHFVCAAAVALVVPRLATRL